MSNNIITNIEFNGELTIKSTDNKNKTIDINFEFGTQDSNGEIISFSGTKNVLILDMLMKQICESGLEIIKRQ